MATSDTEAHSAPSWFVAPGEFDHQAWLAFGLICLALYGLVTLYASFDRWAEHQAKGTPLAKTIPTMLTIALLYEIFPLGHFNILLPIAAILLALVADWSRFHLNSTTENELATAENAVVSDGPSGADIDRGASIESPPAIFHNLEEGQKSV